MQILSRRRKNNPLLTGEPGVGKTAVVEGLALAIHEGKVPDALKNGVIHSLDVGALLAGTRYRGDFEERFKKLLKNIMSEGNSILFIDEVHTVIGAGAAHGSAIDVSNLLKPLLGSGRLRCIGATTTQECRRIFERDRALARRFQQLDINEPNTDDAYQILCGLRSCYEEFHQVKYTNAALRTAVDLAARHIGSRFLPDKAIDVIDEAGAKSRISARKNRKIGSVEVEQIISKMARIPQQSVTRDDRDKLSRLESVLKLAVFGQDAAIDALVSAVKLSRAGLRDTNKTIGSYLFAGPTGVGKTELSRQLADGMSVELLRFDMSEYQERHTVSRLIGAPPGYVGYDEGGQLTDAVQSNPYCVLLLDEIEKAHAEVYNLLLQIMDNGMLTDSNGRQVDFRNVILIMTSNIGAADLSRRSMGFAEQDHSSDVHQAIEKLFSPEFRNRLDATILFRPLDKKVTLSVAQKFIVELQSQLEARKVGLEVDEKLGAWLVKHGYNVRMGARPMKRLIQEHIKKPLAEELLFGALKNKGSTVRISISKDDKIVLRPLAAKPVSKAAPKKTASKKRAKSKATD
jgi:ATP-dependent Clp protease ATP-binding subunit ClpA